MLIGLIWFVILNLYFCGLLNLMIWGKLFMRYNGRIYRKVSNIRRTLVGIKIVDHSDVFGASPVGAAPTTSSFST